MDSIIRRRHYFGIPIAVDKAQGSATHHEEAGQNRSELTLSRPALRNNHPQASLSIQDTLASLDVRDVSDSFGLAFSAGGARSVAFCSGVLRALATADWLEKVDYVSCVSSGVLAASCFISQTSAKHNGRSDERHHHSSWETVDPATGEHGNDPSGPPEDSAGLRHEEGREGEHRGLLLAERAERALHQLRRQCSPSTNPNFLATLHKVGVMIRALALIPMTALAVATLVAASVENLLGSTLQTLLLTGLIQHPMGSVVFFAPLVLASLCWCCHLDPKSCLLFLPPLLLDDPPSLSAHQLPLLAGHVLVSAHGQVAWFSACFLAASWAVLLLMFLDERLLQGSMVDEGLQVLLFALWAFAVVAVVSGRWQLQSGKDQRLTVALQVAQGFSVLWLTARICVMHVMGRAHGMHTYELACAALVLLLLLNDLASRLLHSLYKASIQGSFLGSLPTTPLQTSQSGNDANNEANRLGDIYYGGADASGARPGAAPAALVSSPFVADSQRSSVNVAPPSEIHCHLLLCILDVKSAHCPFCRSRSLSSAPYAHSCIQMQATARMWLGDPSQPSDPLVSDLNLTCQPYILFNASSTGYVRKALQPGISNSNHSQDRYPFLLSAGACGSERTGFFRPPSDLRLSDAIALAAGSRVFSSSATQDDTVLHDKFMLPVLWSGGWLRIPSREPPSPSASLRGSYNPTPNFFLDTTGSRPIPRRSPSALLSSRLPTAVMQCGWRWVAVVLVLCLLLSLITPALFLLPVGVSIALLLLSFLPEGHPLLFLPYLRAVHHVLGIVLHADHPPPYLHVSDSGSMDPLGLFELLRRRCTSIFVCDSVPDPNNDFSALLQVLDEARRELRCAFVAPRDCSGDVSTLIRQFQSNPEQRCLHLQVHYYARNLASSPPGPGFSPSSSGSVKRTENLQKVGSLWLLKCRFTPRDKDFRTPPKSPSSEQKTSDPAGSSWGVGQRVGGGHPSLFDNVRRLCSAVVPSRLRCRSAPTFDEEAFSMYSTLGARAARAAMERCDLAKQPPPSNSSSRSSWTQGSNTSFSGAVTSSLFIPSVQAQH